MNKHPTAPRGFTLIELAVVMTIIALVIGASVLPLSTRLSEQRNSDTQAKLNKAIDAIIGFAALNRRLPCPDIPMGVPADRDGTEKSTVAAGAINGCAIGLNLPIPNSPAANTAGVSWGDLPWATLGLAGSDSADAWNNRIRYAVFMPLVTQTPSPTNLGLANLGNANLEIYCRNTTVGTSDIPGCPASNATALSNTVSFVVYSHGANGYGSTAIGSSIAMTFPTGTLPTNEQFGNLPESEATAVLRNRFVSRPRTDVNSSLGEFDDLVVWVSNNVLAAKLLAAGVWP